jgi:hypothetical protein
VRTFRSAVSGEPKGSHYMHVKSAVIAVCVKGLRYISRP